MITNSQSFSNIVFGHQLRIVEGSLVFPNLFSYETGIRIINPTTTGVQGNFSLETNVSVFTGDLVIPNASNYTDANWVSSGWEPSADLLPRQVAILIGRNKPLNELNQQKNTVIIKGNVNGTNYTVVFIYSGNSGSYAKPVSFTVFPTAKGS